MFEKITLISFYYRLFQYHMAMQSGPSHHKQFEEQFCFLEKNA